MQKGREHSTAERQKLQHCRTARSCRAAKRLGTVAQHKGPLKAGKCSAAQCINCSTAELQGTAALQKGRELLHCMRARDCSTTERLEAAAQQNGG